MKTVILFGGGDGGGLILTENGVRPIPPFDPAIRHNLKSAAAMVNAASATENVNIQRKMAKLATSICNLAVEQVEEVLGPLDADRSLIFQDDEGGFTCGSTGKPPIPLPWPPMSFQSLQEFVAAGVVETEMIDLVKQAHNNNIALAEIFEDPVNIAKKLGLKLSKKSVNDLQMLAPSRLASIKDATDREIVRFFHKVAEDGRYLDTWLNRPYEVSRELKIKLSEDALERLVTRGGLMLQRGAKVAIGPLIVIIIVVIIVDRCKPPRSHIIDRSGIEKI